MNQYYVLSKNNTGEKFFRLIRADNAEELVEHFKTTHQGEEVLNFAIRIRGDGEPEPAPEWFNLKQDSEEEKQYKLF